MKNEHVHSKLARAVNKPFMNISLKFCHQQRLNLRRSLALVSRIVHSSLLGSFRLLVQMDENVSGLVLLS